MILPRPPRWERAEQRCGEIPGQAQKNDVRRKRQSIWKNGSVLHPLFLLFMWEVVLRSRPLLFADFPLQECRTIRASFAVFLLGNPQISPVLNGTFSGKNGLLKKSERKEVKFKMITGIKKKNKLTEIWFDETGSDVTVRTYNTDLKNRLTAYTENYPALCRLTDDDECSCLTFEIDRKRFSIRLTAPYSEERRSKARKAMEAIHRKKQE